MPPRSPLGYLRERKEWTYGRILDFRERSKILHIFKYRDFKLLWTGAFLSFIGSWIQNVAQGYLVYRMTGSNYLLGLVSFFGMVPVTFLGPIAGSLTDMLNRRVLLVVTQSIFAVGALYLAVATQFGFVKYWQIVVVALILGTVSAVEMPTRQSIVSAVVPEEDLPVAIPVNALTFNLARLIGPAVGGILLAVSGPALCYFLNGLSFLALIFAGLAIRADLRPIKREPQPIRDVLTEGAIYTFRDKRLRMLFLLESSVSVFGLFYLSQTPAIADQLMHNKSGGAIGALGTSVAIGAIGAISIITATSERNIKGRVILIAMSLMGALLVALSFVHNLYLGCLTYAMLGLCGISIFNTVNTLFQLLSPPRLRGRVLAMHIWALSGIGPFGVWGFGFLAEKMSLAVALEAGGGCVLFTAAIGWLSRRTLRGI